MRGADRRRRERRPRSESTSARKLLRRVSRSDEPARRNPSSPVLAARGVSLPADFRGESEPLARGGFSAGTCRPLLDALCPRSGGLRTLVSPGSGALAPGVEPKAGCCSASSSAACPPPPMVRPRSRVSQV